MLTSRRYTTLAIVPLFLLILSTSWLYAENIPEQAVAPQDILKIFEQKYTAISNQVSRGELPGPLLDNANRIKRQLKKFMIRRNAALDILKLDILEGSQAERATALDQLNALVADTEHQKMYYLQQLLALTGPGATSGSATDAPLSQMSAAGTAEAIASKNASPPPKRSSLDAVIEGKEIKWNTRDLDIVIEVAPENIATGETE